MPVYGKVDDDAMNIILSCAETLSWGGQRFMSGRVTLRRNNFEENCHL